MKRCIIFCAGVCGETAVSIGAGDYVIAADGGLTHAERLGITPHCILGDFDSLGYVPENSAVFPVEKDDTDSMLAVKQGLALGYRQFVIYGGMEGPRLDHTIANLQTLQYLADRHAQGWLVGRDTMATALKEGSVSFPASADGTISLFCMGKDAKDVTIQGLKYPLTQGTLTAGHPLGVSNHFIGEPATITVGQGSVLILYPKEVGFRPTTLC